MIEWRRSYLNAPPSLFDEDIFSRIDLDEFKLNMNFMNSKYMDIARIQNLMRDNGIYATSSSKQLKDSQMNSYQNSSQSTFPYPHTESLQHCGQR